MIDYPCIESSLDINNPETLLEVSEGEFVAVADFTCYGCEDKDDCPCAFDAYNTGGDCLAAK